MKIMKETNNNIMTAYELKKYGKVKTIDLL